MTRAGVAYYEREQRDLVRINYVEPQRSPLSGMSGMLLGHVGYFAELIDEWAPEAQVDERLYRLGSSAVDALAAGAPVEALARYFEYLDPAIAGCLSVVWVRGVRRRIDARGLGRRAGVAYRRSAGATMPPGDAVFRCAATARRRADRRCRRQRCISWPPQAAMAPDRLEALA